MGKWFVTLFHWKCLVLVKPCALCFCLVTLRQCLTSIIQLVIMTLFPELHFKVSFWLYLFTHLLIFCWIFVLDLKVVGACWALGEWAKRCLFAFGFVPCIADGHRPFSKKKMLLQKVKQELMLVVLFVWLTSLASVTLFLISVCSRSFC